MTKPSIEHLEKQIEHLVADHLAAVRAAAKSAVDRAASRATPSSKTPRTRRRRGNGRRTPEEVAALGERLYEAVVAHPGETMRVLAPQVGATPRELHRPMTRLKWAGRVRSVGQRHQTRYFPMTGT